MKNLTYVDFFAGVGGFRYGIESFQKSHPEYNFECIKTSDIKKDAIQTYNLNFKENNEACDIRTIKDLPHFDILCAGFPCQPFSSAGKKLGLKDEGRGDLIYEVIRICKESKPSFLILENVSNIERIEKGEVLKLIVEEFENIGYNVSCVSINALDVGLAQNRNRVFIIGNRIKPVEISINKKTPATIKDIIDSSDTASDIPENFVRKLLNLKMENVIGKSIKDKRGGDSNIHSWDIEYNGKISDRQKNLLNNILLERRKKKWATEKNMTWMDGIPLSLEDIKTFNDYDELEKDLVDLVSKKYLVMEHPKDLIEGKRVQNINIPIGYNISKGKLSFPVSKILHPDEQCPTLTATDSNKLAVYVDKTIRRLNAMELKRLCGFPDSMLLPEKVNMYDLFGNMVCPTVITSILESLLLQFDD